jgi:hypothetical protein
MWNTEGAKTEPLGYQLVQFSTKVNSHSSAGTKVEICNWLILKCPAQLA